MRYKIPGMQLGGTTTGVRKKKLKLYGERNTGSRYLERILRHNIQAEVLPGVAPSWVARLQAIVPGKDAVRDSWFRRSFDRNLGWKHARVDVQGLCGLGAAIDDVHFLVLVKNPYSWLLSLRKRPYHHKTGADAGSDSLESLLTRPWPTVGRETAPHTYANAIDLWNGKARSYLELAERFPTTLLPYEQLLSDPAAAVESIRLAGPFEWKRGGFENLPESTKEAGKDTGFYRDYYLNELWREQLSADQVRMVNERLDPSLAERLGYTLLQP